MTRCPTCQRPSPAESYDALLRELSDRGMAAAAGSEEQFEAARALVAFHEREWPTMCARAALAAAKRELRRRDELLQFFRETNPDRIGRREAA